MSRLLLPCNAKNLSNSRIWMGNDGICCAKPKPKAKIKLPHMEENSNAANSFYINKKNPLLLDTRNVKTISKGARKQFSTNDRKTRITCFALIAKSPLSRVIGNFFMGLNKPNLPPRLFDDETEAIRWLKIYQ